MTCAPAAIGSSWAAGSWSDTAWCEGTWSDDILCTPAPIGSSWAAGSWSDTAWCEGTWAGGAAAGDGNIVMRLVHETYRRPRRIIAGMPVYDEEEEALVLAIMETLLHE